MKLMLLFSFLLTLPLGGVAAQESLQEVVVSPGDTMWDIANKYLKDPQKWPEIVKVNNLPTADPTIALPGSKIRIPITLIKEEYRTAQLITMVSDVRYKRKNESEFKPATVNMTLRYEDGLRTMKESQARVKFPSKEVVQINENSYVVLKPERILQEVQLLQGDLRASRAKVIMPGGTVVNPRGNNSEYQAKIREDETEVVFVYKGEVNVTAKGKTVRVKEGFGTQVLKSAPPLDPMPLTSFKDFDPANLKTPETKKMSVQASNKPITFSPPTMPPKETESKSGKSKALMAQNLLVSYQLQLAKDSKFRSIVFEKTAGTDQAFDISTQNIPDGIYFMRVAFLDAFGNKNAFSEPAKIVKDTRPPELLNIQPLDGFKHIGPSPACDISGNAKDAVLVSVEGQVVFLGPNGSFSAVVHLKEGINSITVLARDGNGNETTVTRKITYTKK
ncbi:MAG: hypothetical protein KCHDKBKB_02735 [Elusimicrobia bacterium]|nr:hypothetical protein [Elusimicrobiota bacterium]